MQIPGNSFVLSGLIQAIDLMLVKPILGALPWSSALQAAQPIVGAAADGYCPKLPDVLHFADRTTSSRDSALLTEVIL
jgi:hypothetical protein